MEPTRAQLETALINADKTGDAEAATALANALKSGKYEQKPVSQLPKQSEEQKLMGTNVDETILTIATGAIAEPIAGIAGIAQTLNPFADPGAGAKAVEATREALTFQPKTQEGQQTLDAVAGVVEPVSKAISATEDAMGNFAFDLTGSPEIATLAKSTPTIVMELLGLRALGGLKKGTTLIDDAGEATPALRNALKKQGLEFENLSDQARSVIPNKIEGSILPIKESVKGSTEQALIQQIKSGASDNSLAGLRIVNDKIVPDAAALSAIKQGFREGTVQNIKVASGATKEKMRLMVSDMRRIKANEKLESVLRPSNRVGDAAIARLDLVRRRANEARTELNDIAPNVLKGKNIDPKPIINTLEKSLDDLDVRLIEGANGVPVPDFVGSIISKNKPAQRAIKDAIDLLAEGVAPDALRFHKLKRQFDDMIDFKKKGSQGLSKAGEGVLRDLRSALNNSVREISPEYARVNDIISSSLDMFDNLQRAAGTSIDLFGQGGGKALGTKLRTLMGNAQNRINLENSIGELDTIAKRLGGSFNDDVADLARFANVLDDRFGATARTSFRGDIEAANMQTLKDGMPRTMFEAGSKAAEKGFEKLRGVNDFNAFNAMDELLKRK
jgi:hypothetical protein